MIGSKNLGDGRFVGRMVADNPTRGQGRIIMTEGRHGRHSVEQNVSSGRPGSVAVSIRHRLLWWSLSVTSAVLLIWSIGWALVVLRLVREEVMSPLMVFAIPF